MRQNMRDLAHAGIYLCCLCAIIASVIVASAVAFREVPNSVLFEWLHHDLSGPAERNGSHLSATIKNAREIQAALAKPIPAPSPLPPITAQLAYGYLKPGASAQMMARDQKPEKRRLPKAAMEAFAMDGMYNSSASNAVNPELHKVY